MLRAGWERGRLAVSTGTVGAVSYNSLMCSTELLDAPAAPAADAVRAALAELTHAVDVLQSASLDGVEDHAVLAVFRDLEAQRRRMPSVDHRLVTELGCRSTATKLLARGTAELLTELLHIDVAEAKARVRAAAVLGPRAGLTGQPLDPVYPATAAAQAAGTISEKHARIVTGTIGYLPHNLDEDTVALAEHTLVRPNTPHQHHSPSAGPHRPRSSMTGMAALKAERAPRTAVYSAG